ncbi:MAG: response regulator [Rhodoferax sp.]
MTPMRTVLADDHTLVRAGLLKLLESHAQVQVVGQAHDGQEALALCTELRPDLVIVDIAMPRCNGIQATQLLRQRECPPKVLVLSMYDNEEYVRHALAAGASGYLLKDAAPTELALALQALQRDEIYLSPALSQRVLGQFVQQARHSAGSQEAREPHLSQRQREVLALIAQGLSSKQIARKLELSVKTVETHRSRLMQQLGVHEVAGLVRHAVRLGLVPWA